MHGAAPKEIVTANRLIRQAQAVAEAEAALAEAEAAYPSAARPRAEGDNGPRYWCPLLGASCRSCACGAPQGADCEHLTYAGKGGKGATVGVIRHAAKALRAAEDLAQTTRGAAETLARAQSVLGRIAGPMAATAATVALRMFPEGEAATAVAIILGAPIVEEPATRPAVAMVHP